MGRLMKRVRGALGMGLTWAALWAVGGLLLGLSSNLFPFLPWKYFFDIFDAPLPALAIPGFIGGVLFSIVVGIAARGSKFNELSLARFTAWGAVGGFLLSLLPATMVATGLAHGAGETGLGTWKLTFAIMPPLIFLSSASAAVSLLVARRSSNQKLLDGDAAEALAAGDVHPGQTKTDYSAVSRR